MRHADDDVDVDVDDDGDDEASRLVYSPALCLLQADTSWLPTYPTCTKQYAQSQAGPAPW